MTETQLPTEVPDDMICGIILYKVMLNSLTKSCSVFFMDYTNLATTQNIPLMTLMPSPSQSNQSDQSNELPIISLYYLKVVGEAAIL